MPRTIEIHDARDIFTDAPLSLRLDGGRIAWIGAPGTMPEGPPPARRIEAAGRVLSPGFCESHLHLFWGGATLAQLNLLGIEGAAAAAQAIAGFAAQNPAVRLLVAFSANYEFLGPGTRPDRQALDALCPDRQLLVLAVDGHAAWANTAALQAAGLMAAVPAL
ncbi:MAG: amidohydrolase family protein, partial [Paenirhodobacter sp.]|uniref:amidohydrolase family protein n=1 Tax=Paenirhodobacter sp. TaxID=1965326 RepID=UPI003D09D0C3